MFPSASKSVCKEVSSVMWYCCASCCGSSRSGAVSCWRTDQADWFAASPFVVLQYGFIFGSGECVLQPFRVAAVQHLSTNRPLKCSLSCWDTRKRPNLSFFVLSLPCLFWRRTLSCVVKMTRHSFELCILFCLICSVWSWNRPRSLHMQIYNIANFP